MELKLEKKTAKKLFPESPQWFQKVLTETFGSDCFKKKTFEDIKTFEDACEESFINPTEVFGENDTPDEVAYMKLKVIIAAINQGWTPDWDNTDQRKWWPYFKLSSGFGFSHSDFIYVFTIASVGSRLCFESEEKSTYAAKHFIDIYEQFLTLQK